MHPVGKGLEGPAIIGVSCRWWGVFLFRGVVGGLLGDLLERYRETDSFFVWSHVFSTLVSSRGYYTRLCFFLSLSVKSMIYMQWEFPFP